MSMPRYSNDFKKDRQRNRPNIVLPIINTVIGVALIVLIVVLKITTNVVSWPLFIIFIIVMIMFPLASWYNSFFSKKQKTKMLNSFESETELIVEYMNHQKLFKRIEGDTKDINCTFIEDETFELTEFNYDIDKYLISYPDQNKALISLGIGFFSLSVNPDSGIIEGITGLLPRSIWVKRKLNEPNITTFGKGIIEPINFYLGKGIIYNHIKEEDTYYDSKKGLLCIGERKIYPMDEVCEIVKGVKLVTRENKIISIFIHIQSNLTIY